MNLKRLFSRVTSVKDSADFQGQTRAALAFKPESTSPGNNITYLNSNSNEVDIGIDPNMNIMSVQPPALSKGLMYESELVAIFARNYFGFGRENGAILKNMEALQLGRAEIITNFVNCCSAVLERKHSKINKLQSEIIAIEGMSSSTRKRLELACIHLERETSQLEAQISLAEEGKGWVLDALNRYQMGFQRGMREAVEFELMSI